MSIYDYSFSHRRFISYLVVVVVALVLTGFSSAVNGAMASCSNVNINNKIIPERVIKGYTTSRADSEDSLQKVTRAVRNGVNVVVWAFIRLVNDNGRPAIEHGPNLERLSQYINELSLEFGDTLHLVSFGGWNGPHLNTDFSPREMYDTWKEYGGDVFDGIDWDLEGEDTVDGPGNYFTLEVLDAMGEMSQFAKNDGYIVTMAPAESYVDVSTSRFSRYVNLTYAEDKWHQDFTYHGANVYAYVLAKWPDAIDLISIQLYEGYSHASYEINHLKSKSPSKYLIDYVMSIKSKGEGYVVNFEDDKSLNLKNSFVKIPMNKLLIGLANGWAGNDKFLYIDAADVGVAYNELKERHGCEIRGFMFWVIEEEGAKNIDLAKGLNSFLRSRTSSSSSTSTT